MSVRPRSHEIPGSESDRRQLVGVVDALMEVLGPVLTGAYLHGSAVLGGLRPRSDLDVLAVSTRPLTLHEKHRLVDRLLEISGPDPAAAPPRPIELTVVVGSEIRPWRYPPRRDFQYGEWWRESLVRRDPERFEPVTDPDLAILVTMVLMGDSPLLGPPALGLFDPIPRADFVDALLDSGIPGMLDDLESDTRNMVLTLARIWHGVVTGRVVAKDAAAGWALPRLPAEHRAVLERARDIYVSAEDEHWEDLLDRLGPFTDAVVAEIHAARPARRTDAG